LGVWVWLLIFLIVYPEALWSSPQAVTTTLGAEVLNEQNAPVPHALCTITGRLLPAGGVTQESNSKGEVRFPELLPGDYTVSCAAMGLLPVERTFALGATPLVLQLVLPAKIHLQQTVDVTEKESTIAPQQGAPAATLNARQIIDLPLAQQNFKAVLPVLPGVVRTPDGRINIKGLPENQGLMIVNSAEAVDPVTGAFSIDVPLQTIESLQVFKNAYAAEYGGFTGGVTAIYTKPPSSQWHYEIEDFTPNPRIKSGQLVGMADFNPRLYFTGPILASRHLNFSEALAYDIDKQPVRGLAWPKNEIKTRDFSSFTSVQYIFSTDHLATVNANVFPLRRQFANINSFVPQSASSDYGQAGYSVSLNDRYITKSGGIFSTVLQGTEFDSNGHGQGPADMLITPNGYGGNFFNTFGRESNQEELRLTYTLPVRKWRGKHELSVGGSFLRRAFSGFSYSHPVLLLRTDGDPSERIDFTGTGQLSASGNEAALFIQDHWSINDRSSLDAGLRYSSESLGSRASFAPRLGVVHSFGKSGRTVVRSGVGLFYDHVPLLAADFTANPNRQVTFFDSTGRPLGSPLIFRNLYGNSTHTQNSARLPFGTTPYNFTWNLEGDHELRPSVALRANFLISHSYGQFIVNPLSNGATTPAIMGLFNDGTYDYREFEITMHLSPFHDTEWNISYVNSKARGDLNALSQIYVPFEQPVVRPNFYANLPSDIPHRFITWGRFKTHLWKIDASPLFDYHSGFPFSLVDERQNYVGEVNSQRFPRFLSLDLKLSKEFRLPFPWLKNHVLRGALTIFNLTNRNNPRDVYNNITSPYFGRFVGMQHRFFDTGIDILY
jgi:hypothetical protein